MDFALGAEECLNVHTFSFGVAWEEFQDEDEIELLFQYYVHAVSQLPPNVKTYNLVFYAPSVRPHHIRSYFAACYWEGLIKELVKHSSIMAVEVLVIGEAARQVWKPVSKSKDISPFLHRVFQRAWLFPLFFLMLTAVYLALKRRTGFTLTLKGAACIRDIFELA